MATVDRVEITEDSSSSLYGNIAMGGVINIITAHPTRRTIELNPQYGDHNSPKFDFFGSDQWDKVSAAIEGSFLHTDGFPIVAPIERGPIDNNANVEYKNITAKFEFNPSDRVQAFARAGYFSENRNNAKVGELNDTRWTTVNGGVRAQLPDDSDLQARVFVDSQRAHFNFLAVTNAAAARNIVRLATDQHVPTNGVGGMAQWSKALGTRNAFSAGFDWRWVDGESQEAAYVAAVPTSITGVTQAATLSVQRFSGGTQTSLGAFAQDIFTPIDKLVVTVSARVDRWNNYNGHNLETTVATGLPTANNRPVDSRQQRHGGQPARRRAVSRHRSRQLLGRGEFRIPRADADRAVSPILGRCDHDASQRSARAGTAGRRRGRDQHRAGAKRVGPPHVVRQSPHQSGAERHAVADAGAEAERSRNAASAAYRPTSTTASARRGASPPATSSTMPRSPTAGRPTQCWSASSCSRCRGTAARCSWRIRIRSSRPLRWACSSSA